jgi:NAD(P)H-dependent FMN reductase
MSELKIGIILGSTRPGRNGKAVADWVLDKAPPPIGADYDLIDLASDQTASESPRTSQR